MRSLRSPLASAACVVAGLALLLAGPPDAVVHAAPTTDGRALIARQNKLHRLADEQVEWTITITDAGGESKERGATISVRPDGETGLKSLVRFTAPANVRGTGLLTWSDGLGSTDQWLFLPAIRRSVRVATDRRKLALADTDLSVDDFRPPCLDDQRFELLAPAPLDGARCQPVKMTPITPDPAAEVAWRVFWVREDITFTVGIDSYGAGGDLLKTLRTAGLVKVGDTAWRPNRVTVRSIATGSTTTLVAGRRAVAAGLPDRIFTVRELEEGLR